MLGKLKPLLEDPAVLKIAHNLKYDWVMFAKAGIDVAPYDDTLVMSFDLDAGRSDHGLDELAKTHFDHECIPLQIGVRGRRRSRSRFDKVPLDAATEYAAEDADICLRLWQRLKPRLAAEGVDPGLRDGRPAAGRDRRADGAARDQGRPRLSRQAVGRRSPTEIAALEERVYEAADGPVHHRLAAATGRRCCTTGSASRAGARARAAPIRPTSTSWSGSPARACEVARLVLDWRQLTKLKSTYTDALQAQINPETGRVHTSYSLSGAQTGRLSSTEPNLQNIPIRTEIGRQIRDAFVAEPGHVLMSADYSQIELRLAAHMADVPQLKEAFAKGDDIHNMTAEELFGVGRPRHPRQGQDDQFRHPLRHFALGPGRPAGRAARRGQGDHRPLFRALPRHPHLHRRDAGLRPRDMASPAPCSAARPISPTSASPTSRIPRQGAERAAINAPIQGTSADLIKRAMNRMDAALAEAGLERRADAAPGP